MVPWPEDHDLLQYEALVMKQTGTWGFNCKMPLLTDKIVCEVCLYDLINLLPQSSVIIKLITLELETGRREAKSCSFTFWIMNSLTGIGNDSLDATTMRTSLLSRQAWNLASMFFICIYIHIGRNIYYGSYKILHTWSGNTVRPIWIIGYVQTMRCFRWNTPVMGKPSSHLSHT